MNFIFGFEFFSAWYHLSVRNINKRKFLHIDNCFYNICYYLPFINWPSGSRKAKSMRCLQIYGQMKIPSHTYMTWSDLDFEQLKYFCRLRFMQFMHILHSLNPLLI